MAEHVPDTLYAIDEQLEHEYFLRHPAAATGVLELLQTSELVEIFTRQSVAATLAVWERLSPDVGRRLLEALPEPRVAQTLRRLEPAALARLLAGFGKAERDRLLSLVEERTAREVRSVLRYPPECAGSLMDPGARLIRKDSTVSEVLSRLRQERRPGRAGFFVVDSGNQLSGWVDMQDLALAEHDESVGGLVRDVKTVVHAMATREEVAEKMDLHRLSALAVLNVDGQLVGVVRYAAMAEAELEHASVGMQTMVGVSRDERATSSVSFAVRKRLPWLQVNLITVFIAAVVVGLFEDTIARFTALAVLLPVVAGQSGNTGAQALAVTMRGLTLREIRAAQWPRVVLKEASAGFWNGAIVAITTSVAVFLWSGSYGLGLIIALSMVLSVIVAGVAGAAIPTLLTALGQDPAQSSAILLTTITDVAAFLSFLGIATLLAGLI